MTEAVIVATARSPIGRAYKGSLKDLRADELAARMITAALAKVPQVSPDDIDDLILGCGSPGGQQGFNMARVVSVLLGYDQVPGVTVTRYCSSSLQTTRMALHSIKAGEADIVISAGTESVSNYAKGTSDRPPVDAGTAADFGWHHPAFADARARTGAGKWDDPRQAGELPDVYIAMGRTAENVAGLRGVSRAEQDEFALRSQTLAAQAIASGFYERDITPVELPDGTLVTADDCPRSSTTAESLAGLKPVFSEDGTVTAGNCCPLNDGAAALVIMSDTKAAELGITPLARIVSTGVSALSPEIMGLGPVEASRRALARAGLTVSDLDLVEINEAFAAQVVPSYQELGVDLDKVNVHGGAIALGHPFGQTGARLTGTLLNGLREKDGTFGLETMCVGGGQGMAMVVERLS
ncbi:acetyl-CoA C-acetyltransferase [Actinocorallia sp. B10E7]|uniref:acetyl-CoA C-acetyltransferase n=1 Tax=Actinocorallia sp. B10E7 TaxID=3153558 RepID=UPI00325C65AE